MMMSSELVTLVLRSLQKHSFHFQKMFRCRTCLLVAVKIYYRHRKSQIACIGIVVLAQVIMVCHRVPAIVSGVVPKIDLSVDPLHASAVELFQQRPSNI